jgi:hypothetical protein
LLFRGERRRWRGVEHVDFGSSAAALGHGGAAGFAFPSVTHSRKSSYLNSWMSAAGMGW